MVEAAIVLPAILLVVLAIVNFAIVWNHWQSLTDAVRAGARVAATCRFTNGDLTPAFTAYEAAAVDLPGHSAPQIDSCPAAGQPITLTGQYPYSINVMGLVIKSGDLTSATTETTE
jgi:Flp pilus assembly protein TadG